MIEQIEATLKDWLSPGSGLSRLMTKAAVGLVGCADFDVSATTIGPIWMAACVPAAGLPLTQRRLKLNPPKLHLTIDHSPIAELADVLHRLRTTMSYLDVRVEEYAGLRSGSARQGIFRSR